MYFCSRIGKIVHFLYFFMDKNFIFCYNKSMISFFDVENLNVFLQNFYTAVGIRISVFDDEFRLVCEYPKEPPRYCALIRSTKGGPSACRNCDVAAFQKTKESRAPHIYVCHAGLMEAVAPIKLDGGILGYVILAHMLPEENYEISLQNALKKAQQYGLSEEDILPALKDIATHSEEKINACVQILNAVAAYLQISDLVKWKTENVASKISAYVELHLGERINSELLCKKFLISRTKLYQLAMDNYGMSITKYILFKRIEKAKQLLKQGISVSKIAEATGFTDFNYFGKVFKKEVGVSPTEYRKSI